MGGGIVTALVLAMWMMWPASPAPSAAVPAAPVRGAQQTTKPGAIAPVAPVKLDALTAERQGPSEKQRNPFRYQPKAEPPPPKPVAAPTPEVTEAPKPPVPHRAAATAADPAEVHWYSRAGQRRKVGGPERRQGDDARP